MQKSTRNRSPFASDRQVDLFFPVAICMAASLCTLTTVTFAGWAIELYDKGRWIAATGPVLMTIAAVTAGLRWIIFFIFSYTAYKKDCGTRFAELRSQPFVSIFVPAYNEGETIDAALRSLLTLDYPRYEIIVVDDGSSDDTYRRASRYQGDHGNCTIKVYRKPNGGKWSAHNVAFQKSAGELVLCIDADSRLAPDSLALLVRRMQDCRVAGVAGQVRVRNRKNLVTRLQALEYVLANGALRMAQNLTGTVLVVPGPIGLFRRSALEDVFIRFGTVNSEGKEGSVDGPFQRDTFAEDFDLSMAILMLGGRIIYEPKAISYTKAPEIPFGLLNQRYRWIRGTIQVLRKFYRNIKTQNIRPQKHLALWTAASYFYDLMLQPFLFVVQFSGFLISFASGIEPTRLILFFLLFQMLNLTAAAVYTAMHNDDLKLARVLPLYDFYQGIFLFGAFTIAAVDEIRGSRMGW